MSRAQKVVLDWSIKCPTAITEMRPFGHKTSQQVVPYVNTMILEARCKADFQWLCLEGGPNIKQDRASVDCMHLGDDRDLLHADNIEENASNVLTTLHRFNPALGIRTRAYWSSKGSRDENSSEWLLLSLVHPLCLVKSISIRPFRATFQRVHLWLLCHAVCLSMALNYVCHCQAMQ